MGDPSDDIRSEFERLASQRSMNKRRLQQLNNLRDDWKKRVNGIRSFIKKPFGIRVVELAGKFVDTYVSIIKADRIYQGRSLERPRHDEFQNLESQLSFVVTKMPFNDIWQDENPTVVTSIVHFINETLLVVSMDLQAQRAYEQLLSNTKPSAPSPADLHNRALYGNTRHNLKPDNLFFKHYN